MRNPFAKPRPNPRREKERRVHGRVRLRGEDKTELRRQAFERSGGLCENEVRIPDPRFPYPDPPNYAGVFVLKRCNFPITWESMELSHKAHGPRKTDTLDGVLASCKECHRAKHNSGKPVPRKAGRTMTIREANDYWHRPVCFCEKAKPHKTSFCAECAGKLTEQLRFDLEHTLGKDYLRTLALAEQHLLSWKSAEEHA